MHIEENHVLCVQVCTDRAGWTWTVPALSGGLHSTTPQRASVTGPWRTPQLSWAVPQFGAQNSPLPPLGEMVCSLSERCKSWKLSNCLFQWKRIPGLTNCQALCNLRDRSKYLLSNEKSLSWLLLERITQRLPFCLKCYIQPSRGKKKEKRSEWLYGLLNPKSNIIVRAPLLSSSHQILLLALIENPWGPSWKQHSALEKWYKKCLCPSYQNVVSEVCGTSTPSSIISAEKKTGESSETISLLFEMTVTAAVTIDF